MTLTSHVEAGTSNSTNTNSSTSTSTSNHVYVTSDQYSWMPARVVEYSKTDPNQVTVSICGFKDEDSIQSGSTINSSSSSSSRGQTQTTTLTIDLRTYPNRSLPLQNVNEDGLLQQVEDMVDLPFLHEVSRA